MIEGDWIGSGQLQPHIVKGHPRTRSPGSTPPVHDALEMANGLRRPVAGRSRTPTAARNTRASAYTERLDELGAAPPVGSRGDAYDNAMAEAWVATFKSELVEGRRFLLFEHAEHEALHWIGFHNGESLHEALGDLPPAEYEELSIRKGNSPETPSAARLVRDSGGGAGSRSASSRRR